MILTKLIRALSVKKIVGDEEILISGIQSDSRMVEKDALFVAVKGTTVDGHDYIKSAVEKGASAIVCEIIPDTQHQDVTYIVVRDSAEALGILLDVWYDHPSSKLTLVGVTGTNGKTTVATLLYNLFRKLGHKAGLLSTVCNYINDEMIPAMHTTPDPITLQYLLARMVEAGCEYAFMEVSSHAIDQQRISGLRFAGGIFTNLSRDHLDYHKTVDHYLKTKKKFFDNLPDQAFALTNIDDKSGMVMLQNTAARKLTYSLQTLADFKGKIIESHIEGTELIVNGREVNVQFVGKFNAYNLLAVFGAAVSLGKDPEETLIAISDLHPVSGRFETIRSTLGYTAIVDYAHTPDALTNVLNSIQDILKDSTFKVQNSKFIPIWRGQGEVQDSTFNIVGASCSRPFNSTFNIQDSNSSRIITVVGAGGNRDKGKRPIMAKEACRLSDLVILTSDNPRFEDPETIIQDMVDGLNESELARTLRITNREQAIHTAVHLAQRGDVILIAGKGHEDYQEINGIKHHFDDREIIKTIFASQKIT